VRQRWVGGPRRWRIRLAVVNESTLMPPEAAIKAVSACAAQIKLHVAPQWGMLPADVIYVENSGLVPADAHRLTILDEADESGVVGYHRVTSEGLPFARVFVRRILNHAGEFLTDRMSVSSVLSHEICEWFVDPYLNLWADGPAGQYAVEICDPVDGDVYAINGVTVSNFVTKHFFNPHSRPDMQFDHLCKLTRPFSATTFGRMQVRRHGKTEAIRGGRLSRLERNALG
jgi:hypothetical protein